MMSSSNLIKSKVNGVEVYSSGNLTILKVCSNLGIEIPRYCFHHKLSIAGNCRMCLVEIYGVEKPVISCAQMISHNVHIVTNSELVKRMREGISKFLLYNHPLDCAICDQGGECDLQDQVMVYGTDNSRYYDYKRTVLDKECGPLIKTVMTRCIHCTRCVRFLTEIAGDDSLGVLGRGQGMEIGNYLDKIIGTELSGNIIDLCPVGALTSKPGAFRYRSWELRSVETLDFFDSLHSNIRVDLMGNDIVRIVPVINEDINEEWISDKVRFSYDGLVYQRLGYPLCRVGSSLITCSWKDVIIKFLNLFYLNYLNKNIFFIKYGAELGSYNLVLLDIFSKLLYNSYLDREVNFGIDLETDFLLDVGLGIKLSEISEYDYYILIGYTLRLDSPILNLKLRKGIVNRNSIVYTIGGNYIHGLNYQHKGLKVSSCFKLNKLFKIQNNKMKGLILINNLLISQCIINNIKKFFKGFSVDIYTFNLLFNTMNEFNYGSISSIYHYYNSIYYYLYNKSLFFFKKGKKQVVFKNIYYFIGVNDNILNNNLNYKSYYNYVIYHSYSGEYKLLNNVDLILPSNSWYEESDIVYNIINKKQSTHSILTAPSYSKSYKDFFNILIRLLVKIFKIYNFNSDLIRKDTFINGLFSNKVLYDKTLLENKKFIFSNKYIYSSYYVNILNGFKDDYYNTNLLTKSSKIMALCSSNINSYSNYSI